jgi:hemerythrin-like domain-containing protein
MPATQGVCLIYLNTAPWEDAMVEIIKILREEHRNIEKLLRVMEQELNVFDRGERPDYEVFGAIIEFFKKYPDSCQPSKGGYHLQEI